MVLPCQAVDAVGCVLIDRGRAALPFSAAITKSGDL